MERCPLLIFNLKIIFFLTASSRLVSPISFHFFSGKVYNSSGVDVFQDQIDQCIKKNS